MNVRIHSHTFYFSSYMSKGFQVLGTLCLHTLASQSGRSQAGSKAPAVAHSHRASQQSRQPSEGCGKGLTVLLQGNGWGGGTLSR